MNLLKAASTVSLFTLLSRVTGLVRDQVIAASFGVSALTDAFNVAFRIPNLLRDLETKRRLMRAHWLDAQRYLAPPHY